MKQISFYFQNGIDEAFDFDVSEINNEKVDDDLAALIESSKQVSPITKIYLIPPNLIYIIVHG